LAQLANKEKSAGTKIPSSFVLPTRAAKGYAPINTLSE